VTDYDDEYSTCRATYATLRLYLVDLTPDAVTERLGLRPTESQTQTRSAKHLHAWFLCSAGQVDSREVRRHIDWILDQITPVVSPFRDLIARGVKADVACCWVSASGHGGPTLSPIQMRRLAELGLECWFDVYAG
jgi:hypothetical protein